MNKHFIKMAKLSTIELMYLFDAARADRLLVEFLNEYNYNIDKLIESVLKA